MRVTVTGATGTIGRALVGRLRERGDEVTALSRHAARASTSLGVPACEWNDPKADQPPAEALRGHDAVVHLLGETIAQRWNDEVKRELRDSRVLTTRNLVATLRALPDAERPRVLVSQSATGLYGPRGDERLDESVPAGDDFLAGLVTEWEAEARAADELGVRVVVTRTGVVLSESGGALEK
ncbi:MAG: NAD(P)H-binding protein, partial [Thermoleophilaceae bacterium]|nr:NAD(P)H-binding protein [Thermoleophilaceae bacterium]